MLDAFGTHTSALLLAASQQPHAGSTRQLVDRELCDCEREAIYIVIYDSNRRATTKTAQFERAGHHGAPRGGAALAGFREQMAAACHRFATTTKPN